MQPVDISARSDEESHIAAFAPHYTSLKWWYPTMQIKDIYNIDETFENYTGSPHATWEILVRIGLNYNHTRSMRVAFTPKAWKEKAIMKLARHIQRERF